MSLGGNGDVLIEKICAAMLRGEPIDVPVKELEKELDYRFSNHMRTDISVDNFARALGVINFVKPEYYSLLLQHINFTDPAVSRISAHLLGADRRASERGNKNIEQLLHDGNQDIFKLLKTLGNKLYDYKDLNYGLTHLAAILESGKFDKISNNKLIKLFFVRSANLQGVRKDLAAGNLIEDKLKSAFCKYWIKDPLNCLAFFKDWQTKADNDNNEAARIINDKLLYDVITMAISEKGFVPANLHCLPCSKRVLEDILQFTISLPETDDIAKFRLEIVHSLYLQFSYSPTGDSWRFRENDRDILLRIAERKDVAFFNYLINHKKSITDENGVFLGAFVEALELLDSAIEGTPKQVELIPNSKEFKVEAAIDYGDSNAVLDYLTDDKIQLSPNFLTRSLKNCIYRIRSTEEKKVTTESMVEILYTLLDSNAKIDEGIICSIISMAYDIPFVEEAFQKLCSSLKNQAGNDYKSTFNDLLSKCAVNEKCTRILLDLGADDVIGALKSNCITTGAAIILLERAKDIDKLVLYPVLSKTISHLVGNNRLGHMEFITSQIFSLPGFIKSQGAQLLFDQEYVCIREPSGKYRDSISNFLKTTWDMLNGAIIKWGANQVSEQPKLFDSQSSCEDFLKLCNGRNEQEVIGALAKNPALASANDYAALKLYAKNDNTFKNLLQITQADTSEQKIAALTSIFTDAVNDSGIQPESSYNRIHAMMDCTPIVTRRPMETFRSLARLRDSQEQQGVRLKAINILSQALCYEAA